MKQSDNPERAEEARQHAVDSANGLKYITPLDELRGRVDELEKRLMALEPDQRLAPSSSSVTGNVCISCGKPQGGYFGKSACAVSYCPFR